MHVRPSRRLVALLVFTAALTLGAEDCGSARAQAVSGSGTSWLGKILLKI